MQANINGYSGRAASVFGAFDEASSILVIAAAADLLPRREGCVLIASDAREDRDGLFRYEDLRDGILAYYALKDRVANDGQSLCLRFSQKAMRAEPASAIELDGIDVNGPMYRIAPEASNAQIGALALCRQARRHEVADDVVAMTGELDQALRKVDGLLRGRAVTF